jgi:hypothetical protein
MRLCSLLPLFLFGPAAASTLNITTLGAKNRRSTLECWALEPGFKISSQTGTSGSQVLNLGPIGGGCTGNASYAVLPAGFDGGQHNAPAQQYVNAILFQA